MASHPGQFFGITAYGTEEYFKDNSLNIANHALPLDKWQVAFKKLDYDNSNSIDRDEIPDVVRHLYWGRIPAAHEIDAFMLHFDQNRSDKITWDEFMDSLNNYRQMQAPEGMETSVTEFKSGEKYRSAWRTHTRLDNGPKQILQRPVCTSQEYGFLSEEVLAMNGSANMKFRRRWTDLAKYGDCVDRNNQGRTVASEMSPSMKKTMHEAQGNTIMLL